jgi:hypothetical protein
VNARDAEGRAYHGFVAGVRDSRFALDVEESDVDAKLRAITEQILSMPIDDRLRQLEAEANFFATIRPLDE